MPGIISVLAWGQEAIRPRDGRRRRSAVSAVLFLRDPAEIGSLFPVGGSGTLGQTNSGTSSLAESSSPSRVVSRSGQINFVARVE
jgi:hypothetical protein